MKEINTQSLVNRIKYLEKAVANLTQTIKLKEDHILELQEDVRILEDFRENESCNRVWVWQGDGCDYTRSMSNDLPILIRAYQLRLLLEKGETILEEI